MSLLYHAYVYLEFLILACTIYILAPKKSNRKNTIFDIDVPVIFLIGTYGRNNSVQQMMYIQRLFENKKYTVEVFSDAKECMLFQNCHWLSMLSESQKSNAEKVILANHYIKQVEIEENPDLIIIGMMSGTSTFGNEFVEDFGINVYSMSQGVRPDCVILNVMFGDYDQTELDLLGEEIAGVIGEDVDFYNITNKIVDMVVTQNTNDVHTIDIDVNFVMNSITRFDEKKVFCCAKGDSEYERLVEAIIDKLAGYADIVSI